MGRLIKIAHSSLRKGILGGRKLSPSLGGPWGLLLIIRIPILSCFYRTITSATTEGPLQQI